MPRALIIIVGGLVVVGGIGAFLFFAKPPEETAPAPVSATPTVRTPTPTAAAPTPTPRSAEPTPAKPEPTPTPEAAPTTATLVFESDVPDTGVFIDRVFVGTAPVTAKNIKPGPHTVNFSATGYEGQVESIDVEAGTRTFSIKFKEVRLNASVTGVVHKHAMGSCTGALKATPAGLTYETANKGDAFTAALTDLETFEMDYLAKTLRLKIKGGKSFSFTEPEAKADRLYAFHKEVDSARQRLLKGR
jgi:hypothetical protein